MQVYTYYQALNPSQNTLLYHWSWRFVDATVFYWLPVCDIIHIIRCVRSRCNQGLENHKTWLTTRIIYDLSSELNLVNGLCIRFLGFTRSQIILVTPYLRDSMACHQVDGRTDVSMVSFHQGSPVLTGCCSHLCWTTVIIFNCQGYSQKIKAVWMLFQCLLIFYLFANSVLVSPFK